MMGKHGASYAKQDGRGMTEAYTQDNLSEWEYATLTPQPKCRHEAKHWEQPKYATICNCR